MAITAIGIGSGLPLADLLTQLEASEKTRLAPFTNKKTAVSAKISAFGTLKSALSKLQTAAKALNESKTFSPLTSSLSGKGVVAAVSSAALPGNYEVKVNTLAQSHNIASLGFASKTDAIVGAGTLSIGVGSGAPVGIAIDEGSSLETIRNKINSADAGVTASIVNTGDAISPFRLSVVSKTTGEASEISMGFTGTGELVTKLSDPTQGGTMVELQAASNATLTVNGLDIISSTNTVEDALQGVTLTLKEKGETQMLTIERDQGALKKSITNFVDAYNSYVTSSKSLTAYNEDPAYSGKLLGDGTLRGIQSKIRSAMNTPEEADSTLGQFRIPAEFGIKLTSDGLLEVDDAKLTAKIASNSEELKRFFVGDSFTTGYAGRLNDTLEQALKFEGTIEVAQEGLNKTLSQIDKDIKAQNDRIESTIARYRAQFASMDSMVSSMNSMMTYLAQQFDAMAAQTKSK